MSTQPDSKIESWTKSKGLRLATILTVGGIVTAVIAFAWYSIAVTEASQCVIGEALVLQGKIQALPRGQTLSYPMDHDICPGPQTDVDIPAGTAVNISASSQAHRSISDMQFTLHSGSRLTLTNITIKNSALQINITENVTRSVNALGGAIRVFGDDRGVRANDTVFYCFGCHFKSNRVLVNLFAQALNPSSAAYGGAVYINGTTAKFRCIDCQFSDNEVSIKRVNKTRLNISQISDRALGGALYIGGGASATLINALFQPAKSNGASCVVPTHSAAARKASCVQDGTDVYVEPTGMVAGCHNHTCSSKQICSNVTTVNKCFHNYGSAAALGCGLTCQSNGSRAALCSQAGRLLARAV